MNDVSNNEQLYIVISQTGTFLSRILKLITGAEYNHASIGLCSDLDTMYSFGRKYPYNPFLGGFVTESPNSGTFKRFSNTKVIVLAINIDPQKYLDIKNMLNLMITQKRKYRYNYLGLYLAAIKVVHKSHNRYYCSEFVRDILQRFGIKGSDNLSAIVKPIDFLTLPETTRIYSGKLQNYSEFYKERLAKVQSTAVKIL